MLIYLIDALEMMLERPYDLSFKICGSQPSSEGGICTKEDPFLSCECWCDASSGNDCLESCGGGGGGGRGGPASGAPR